MLYDKIKRAFDLTKDLVMALDEDHLPLYLGQLPSNTIGQQLWCIVGARESYIKAIENDAWIDFSCSLSDTTSKDLILKALTKTELSFDSIIDLPMTNERESLLFDLLGHEIQHHGQLIRYVYGNKLSFPQSWNDQYTV